MGTDAIMAMVEKELRAHPDISSSELKARVAKKHSAAKKLTTRQFHARYPLRVKKRWSLESSKSAVSAGGRPSKRSRRSTKGGEAEGTREVLAQFANELLQMREASFTNVLARVEHYAKRLEG